MPNDVEQGTYMSRKIYRIDKLTNYISCLISLGSNYADISNIPLKEGYGFSESMVLSMSYIHKIDICQAHVIHFSFIIAIIVYHGSKFDVTVNSEIRSTRWLLGYVSVERVDCDRNWLNLVH